MTLPVSDIGRFYSSAIDFGHDVSHLDVAFILSVAELVQIGVVQIQVDVGGRAINGGRSLINNLGLKSASDRRLRVNCNPPYREEARASRWGAFHRSSKYSGFYKPPKSRHVCLPDRLNGSRVI